MSLHFLICLQPIRGSMMQIRCALLIQRGSLAAQDALELPVLKECPWFGILIPGLTKDNRFETKQKPMLDAELRFLAPCAGPCQNIPDPS